MGRIKEIILGFCALCGFALCACGGDSEASAPTVSPNTPSPLFYPTATLSAENCGLVPAGGSVYGVVTEGLRKNAVAPFDDDFVTVTRGGIVVNGYDNVPLVSAAKVQVGDKVCLVSSDMGQGGIIMEPTQAAPTSTSMPTIEPTSIYAPPDPNVPVNCTDLGLVLDNAITAACLVPQNEIVETTLICDGTNGQEGFITIAGYDVDLQSADNPPAVSVHAQIGSKNKALPRDDFGSSCADWRYNFPDFMDDNPDLFFGYIPTPPTGTPEASSYIDKRNESRADHASLVASVSQKQGTIYADVFAASKMNTAYARGIPGKVNPHRGRF